jgi:acetyltransferase-like isoleucine patch superfamily enzyme
MKSITQKINLFLFQPKVNGSNILNRNRFIYNVKFDIVGENNILTFAKDLSIENASIFIRGNNHTLTFNENAIFKSGLLWFEDNFNSIILGKGTTVENAHIAVTENNQSITIGADCLISHGISIRNGDSHSIIENKSQKRINHSQIIRIDDHVWIGANVTILKGAIIEKNSIIGIGSIVTKKVDANCVYAGVPAKKLNQVLIGIEKD